MQLYSYTAKDEAGKTFKGKVEARDERQALSILRARKLVVISLQEGGGAGNVLGFITSRTSKDDLVQFTVQMSTMINSGLPLTDAISLLQAQSRSSMSKILGELQSDVEGGVSLAEAMNKHPEVFSAVYVSLVRAGEASGKLDEVLAQLATNEEKSREFAGKVKGALIYPAIIVVAMILVISVIMIFVVPQLTQIYTSFDAELPFMTQVLIGMSNFVRVFWWVIVLGIGGGIFFLRQWYRTREGNKAIDKFLLDVPYFGELKTLIVMTDFSRTLSLLVQSGISILQGLEIVADTVGNVIFEEAMKNVQQGVEKGMPLAAMLAQQRVFPPLMSQMVAVGEETGKLDEVLGKVAHYYEQIVEQRVKNLTTAIEPVIMIMLGIVVAFIVFSVITPLYSLTELF